MKQEQFNRIMKMSRETGERVVVADGASDEVFVLMPLDEYENMAGLSDGGWLPGKYDFNGEAYKDSEINEEEDDLAGPDAPFWGDIGELSEQELAQKINRDIADWKAAQKIKDDEALAEGLAEEKAGEPVLVEENGEKEVELAKKPFGGMARLGDVLTTEKYLNGDFSEGNRPATGLVDEVDLSDVKEEAPEEEKFYLEPVE
ncbi:MAG: hypothetical protein PHD72_02705 [Patescibacteria group bacterium]|nr:hypothetical protein [Patescibacteria group bacterium]